jgi:hypothetical protein
MVYPVYVSNLTIEGLNPVIHNNLYNIAKDPQPGRVIRITATVNNDYGAPMIAATVNFKVNGQIISTSKVSCLWAANSYISMCTNYTFPGYGTYSICAEVDDASVVPATPPYPAMVPNCLEYGCPDYG